MTTANHFYIDPETFEVYVEPGDELTPAIVEALDNIGAKRIEPDRQGRVGVQEPPNDPMIYNRRQADGTFRSLVAFWERDGDKEAR